MKKEVEYLKEALDKVAIDRDEKLQEATTKVTKAEQEVKEQVVEAKHRAEE